MLIQPPHRAAEVVVTFPDSSPALQQEPGHGARAVGPAGNISTVSLVALEA